MDSFLAHPPERAESRQGKKCGMKQSSPLNERCTASPVAVFREGRSLVSTSRSAPSVQTAGCQALGPHCTTLDFHSPKEAPGRFRCKLWQLAQSRRPGAADCRQVVLATTLHTARCRSCAESRDHLLSWKKWRQKIDVK